MENCNKPFFRANAPQKLKKKKNYKAGAAVPTFSKVQ